MILVNITQTNHRFLNHIKFGDTSEIHLKFWLERFGGKKKFLSLLLVLEAHGGVEGEGKENGAWIMFFFSLVW